MKGKTDSTKSKQKIEFLLLFAWQRSNMDALQFGNKPFISQWQTNTWVHNSNTTQQYYSWKGERERDEEKEKNENRKLYIHCLLWACASDYPWSRTLTEHDWSPVSRLQFEPKTKSDGKKKENTICALFKSSVWWLINVSSHAFILKMCLH